MRRRGGRMGRRRWGLVLVGGPLLALALLWALTRQTTTASAPHIRVDSGVVLTNLTYCTAGGLDLKLDLYRPPPLTAAPAPVAIYIHGGGWQEGDKSWVDRILPPDRLVARGYAVAAVNYRLAPSSQWPAPIEDVKCAVRFLRAHAAAYGLDPARIGVWGESAGGHLAALLGLAGPGAGLEGPGGWAGQSSAVQAVVDLSGPADLRNIDLTPANRLLAQMLLGRQPDAALLAQVSPVTYARRDAPPFLIVHGAQDTLVAPANARQLHAALQAAGAQSTLVMVQHAGHVFIPAGGGPVQPSVAEINTMIAGFFDRALANTEAGGRTFTETGKTVRGPFLTAWTAGGGVAAFGYPVSEALQEQPAPGDPPTTVQYFERAELAYHPERPGAAAVEGLPLGALRYAALYPRGAPGPGAGPAPGAPAAPGGSPAAGAPFLAAWQAGGGAARYGAPLAAPFPERSPLDGQVYTVQYFERAVLELHPAGTAPGAVLPAQIGTLRYRARYPAAAP